ncbi:TolC family protein [Maribacter sp. HTCC2170]|uniref:TolC family protein n=1 Tax=Maribacter sp. (strain HTCC2170 / KCCM 42371) TaxID=313603 RepID=UPI00006AFCD3|nr:TolC family protein [Maribacter sp. HTCC2170]EAR01151.1 putative outer membrane protein [Maribacter sp. HTCC2170]
MRNVTALFLMLFITGFGFSQSAKTVTISILADKTSEEMEGLFTQLQNEIKAVVGQDATILFGEVLGNGFDLQSAQSNYESLINDSSTDIILAFGTVNNLVITKQTVHKKPTILFGAVNSDLVDIDPNKQSSGIDNFTYLITSQSYKKDLQTFKSLYDYQNLGILVEDFLPTVVPLKETLDKELTKIGASFELVPFGNVDDIKNSLEGFDAVYLAGGFLLTLDEIKELADFLIANELPSFTATNIDDVSIGLLATNQAKENMNIFFRRIALDIEAIVNGTNPSKLPIFLDSDNNLTVNYNTAELVGVPIKYSLITTIDFVGDFKNVLSKRTYTLLDVMKEVTENNLSLQSERKSVALAKQEVKTAKSNYYPNVSANATGSYLDPRVAEISGGQNPEYSTNGSIVLNQTIFSEAANANIAIQKNLEKAQQETYNAAELDAILNASTAYFNTLILKTNVQIQAQNLEVTEKNLQIAEQNYEAGQASKTDVLRFKSERAQNTQTLVEAGNQLDQAFYGLNQLLNNPIDYEIDVVDAELEEGLFKNYNYKRIGGLIDDPTTRKHFVAFLIEEAKNVAPELKSLDYNLKANERSLKLNSYGRFVPTLGLQGQYNRDFNQWGVGSIPAPTLNDNYNIGLNVSIPIFQQYQQNINKQTALIQQDQLNINKENTQLNIERNVNDAVLNIINEIANIELSKVSEETAKESLDLTQSSYLNGAVPITQLLDAQRNYLQARLSKANASYNFLLSFLQMERYLGGYLLLHTETENQEFIQRFGEFMLNRN